MVARTDTNGNKPHEAEINGNEAAQYKEEPDIQLFPGNPAIFIVNAGEELIHFSQ